MSPNILLALITSSFALIPWIPATIEHTTQHAEAHTPTQAEVVIVEHRQIDTAIKAVEDALNKEVTEETKNRIKYLYQVTKEHDIPFYDAVKTIYCESQWYSIKSGFPGEESYGVAQINTDFNPSVTKDDALDPYFSIDWLAENWHTSRWYGYDRKTGQCDNELVIHL